MADKGCDIEDLLSSKQVSLNLPSSLQNQTQFSAQDVLQTKTFAKVRIHVERAIRRIKEFHYLTLTFHCLYWDLSINYIQLLVW